MSAQKNKEKTVKIIFADLALKTLQALFSNLFWDSVSEIPQKKNHFKVNVKSRSSK